MKRIPPLAYDLVGKPVRQRTKSSVAPAQPVPVGKSMWIRYLLMALVGFASSKLGPDVGQWLSDVTAVALGY